MERKRTRVKSTASVQCTSSNLRRYARGENGGRDLNVSLLSFIITRNREKEKKHMQQQFKKAV